MQQLPRPSLLQQRDSTVMLTDCAAATAALKISTKPWNIWKPRLPFTQTSFTLEDVCINRSGDVLQLWQCEQWWLDALLFTSGWCSQLLTFKNLVYSHMKQTADLTELVTEAAHFCRSSNSSVSLAYFAYKQIWQACFCLLQLATSICLHRVCMTCIYFFIVWIFYAYDLHVCDIHN